jgi:ABC-2 type transport system permease protein
MSELKTFFAYIKTSIHSSVRLRESFLLQSLFMLLSNVVFFSFWWIYFANFGSVKGWTLSDMAILYAIVNGAYGLFSTFFGGCRFLARMIFEGDLDALLVKPKNVLLQVMGSKSVPSGWGDIFSSCFFLIASGSCTVETVPLIMLFIFTACAVICSFSIIMGSLAFWIGDSHMLSKQVFEFLLTFSNYPKSLYVGSVKYFLLTIIPSGFIGFMPVEVLKEYSLVGVFSIVGFSALYFVFAAKIFYRGLRCYSSGNRSGLKI